MGNSVKPFKQQAPSFAYQPLTIPLISVEAQNENLRVFRFAELKKATKKFRQDRVVECENGSVRKFYKGCIDETTFAPSRTGTGIAISVMECDSSRSQQDWMAVVRSLEQISHPNLVKFLGYSCEENKSFFLVFEYSHKGSLDRHIFGKGETLPWETRVKIAIGTAQGLAFLHSIKTTPLHRELRMRNILLDEQYNAKLFYLESTKQSLVDDDVGKYTEIFEYLSPEYGMSGRLDMKSDVYVLGMILLDLLIGSKDRRKITSKQSLDVWNTSLLPDNYRIGDIIDHRLGNDYPANAATQMGTLINRCTEMEIKKRPSMLQVLDGLNDIATSTDVFDIEK